MSQRLELIEIGDELGVLLPEHLLSRFGLKAGDELNLEQIGGSLFLRIADTQAPSDYDKS